MSAPDVAAPNRAGMGGPPSGSNTPGVSMGGQYNRPPFDQYDSRSGTPQHQQQPDAMRSARAPQTAADGSWSNRNESRETDASVKQGSRDGGSGQRAGNHYQHDPASNAAYHFHSSPTLTSSSLSEFGQPLAAPRAMPPIYPRFNAASPASSQNLPRSPSPNKRGQGLRFSEHPQAPTVQDRWANMGPAQGPPRQPPPPGHAMDQTNQLTGGSSRPMSQPPQRPGLSTVGESFNSYNDMWTMNDPGRMGGGERPIPPPHSAVDNPTPNFGPSHPSRTFSLPPPNEHESFPRFDSAYIHNRDRDEAAQFNTSHRELEHSGRLPLGIPGMPASGSVSPRSLLHYHQQQIQAQQQMAIQAAQGGMPHPPGPHSALGGPPPPMGGPSEEITTVFIVGFPDDMTEREFANIFLFAKGFEASTLKIPSGGSLSGPSGQHRDGGPMTGPGGPYSSVNLPSAGLFDLAGPPPLGGWDDHSLSLAISRATSGDPLSMTNLGNLGSTLSNMNNSSNLSNPNALNAAKIKQIIGFAKFRTRAEALEARDALNGRKIDVERGCVLKTEMAKKNLHTKQRPVLLNSNSALPDTHMFNLNPSGLPPSGPPPLPAGMGQAGRLPPPNGPPGGQHNLPSSERDRFERDRYDRGRQESSNAGTFFQGNIGHQFDQPHGGPVGGNQQPNGVMQDNYAHSVEMFGPGATNPNAYGGGNGQNQPPSGGPDSAAPKSAVDKWNSMGPLDYYNDPPQGRAGFGPAHSSQGPPHQQQQMLSQQGQSQQPGHEQGGQHPSGSSQPQAPPGRPEWGDVGSPSSFHSSSRPLQGPFSPPLPGTSSGWPSSGSRKAMDDFAHSESSTGRLSDSPPKGMSSDSQSAARFGHQQQDQGGRQEHSSAFATRFGSLRLDGNDGPDGSVGSPLSSDPSGSHEPPSPQQFRSRNLSLASTGSVVQIINLPSKPSSPEALVLEEQLQTRFGERPGFRGISFQRKGPGNGGSTSCFVRFEDDDTANMAASALSGDTLGGRLQAGLHLSVSSSNAVAQGYGGSGSGGPPFSLAQAGESMRSTPPILTPALHFDLDSLNHLEEASYKEGFSSGHEHGRVHGSIEGRELGRQKGFEMWAEVGYYEGMARLWVDVVTREGGTEHNTNTRKQSKQLQHLSALQSLIATFPTTNRSDLPEALPINDAAHEDNDVRDLDMAAHLEKIRARYRLTCSILGVPTQALPISTPASDPDDTKLSKSQYTLVGGRLVDPTQLHY